MLSLPSDNGFYYYCDECSEKINKKKRGKTFFVQIVEKNKEMYNLFTC